MVCVPFDDRVGRENKQRATSLCKYRSYVCVCGAVQGDILVEPSKPVDELCVVFPYQDANE